MEVSKTQCSFLSELNTFEPSIAMLSATQSSEEDERYLGMTNTVRDGLLVFDGEGVKAGDLDRSAHADATNSTNTNAGDICGELLRKTRALGIALGRQQQRRRRTSVFSLGSDPASRLGCHPVLAHISPDTRAIVESLSDAASAHPTLLVRAVLHARDSRRLFAGLLEIVRDCEPDSRLLAHALEIALVLVRDRNLRSQLASLNAIDVVAPKVHVARENQSLILRFLEVATKHSTTSTMIATSSPETKSLVSFLQNHILTSITPSLSVLPIMANLCANQDLASYLNSLPHSERFFRQILGYLSSPDVNFLTVIHSLHILVRLTVDDALGQKFFKDSNIDQIWKLVFSMLEKGAAYSLEPVLDLLEETIAIPKFRNSFEQYITNTTFAKQAIIHLHLNSPSHSMLFKFLNILLDANLAVQKVTETVLEREILPSAFRLLANIVSGGQAALPSTCADLSVSPALPPVAPTVGAAAGGEYYPDGGDALVHACAFVRNALELVQEPAATTSSPDLQRQLVLQFGLSIRVLLRAICDAFSRCADTSAPEDGCGWTQLLSADAMTDVMALCDVVAGCAELRLRAENFVTVQLDALIAFLAHFAEDGRGVGDAAGLGLAAFATAAAGGEEVAGTRAMGWGAEMVVTVLHLVIVAAEVKKDTLPAEVIDSTNIKFIIADSLRAMKHEHVIHSCLNIIAQCPSIDYFVPIFARINSSKPFKSSQMTVAAAAASRVDGGLARESLGCVVDQMSNSLAELEISEPTPMAQMDEAERSIQVLTQLEREVGHIAERMKKEMELKEAIAERKIAAHESKAQLLKGEIVGLQELLDEKMITIRQLEAAQSESFRKNTEYSSALSFNDAELRRLKNELESLRMPLKLSQERCESLEGDLQEKNRIVSEKSQALEGTKSALAQLTKKFDELEKMMENATLHTETQLNEYKERLVVKEELEVKLLSETKSLRARLKTCTDEKDRLAALVEKYQDEEQEHDDLVKRLAQLANIASTKRGH